MAAPRVNASSLMKDSMTPLSVLQVAEIIRHRSARAPPRFLGYNGNSRILFQLCKPNTSSGATGENPSCPLWVVSGHSDSSGDVCLPHVWTLVREPLLEGTYIVTHC